MTDTEKSVSNVTSASTIRPREIHLQNLEDAKTVLESGKPADTVSLLQDAEVLMYGEIHIDYAIPDYLLTQVAAFKQAGVTSFGFEINPDPEIQKIFDEINAGNFDNADTINWSLGFGNPTVRQTKQNLALQLVKAGIRVYPFASWNKQGDVADKPYTKESEEQAALIINNQSQDGKSVVLVGSKHAEYGQGRKIIKFPHTADCVNELGKKTKSVIFAGGMNNPLEYNRDPEVLIKRAARGTVRMPTYIDTTEISVDKYHGDGILVLPEVPFLAANMPIPPERKPAGGFTQLENVQPTGALEEVREVISNFNPPSPPSSTIPTSSGIGTSADVVRNRN